MISARKSAINVANANITKRTEEIKKVDIDIFDSGESEVVSYKYRLQELIPGTPIKLMYIDEDTGYMRFRINVDCKEKFVKNLVLDSEATLKPQQVLDETTGEAHYEIGFKMKEARGSHYMNLKVGAYKKNDNQLVLDVAGNPIVDSYSNYFYKFHILIQEKGQMSMVDVPQDAYRDALLNVTKLWLLSSKFDRVRRPDWAGFFDDRLRRFPMNEEGARQVEKELKNAIAGKIGEIYISDCKATPKLADRSWDVAVVSTDLSTQITTAGLPDNEKLVTINVDNENVKQDGSLISILQPTGN